MIHVIIEWLVIIYDEAINIYGSYNTRGILRLLKKKNTQMVTRIPLRIPRYPPLRIKYLPYHYWFESQKVNIPIAARPLALKIFAVVMIRQNGANTANLANLRTNQARMVLEHGESIMKKQTHWHQLIQVLCIWVFLNFQRWILMDIKTGHLSKIILIITKMTEKTLLHGAVQKHFIITGRLTNQKISKQ